MYKCIRGDNNFQIPFRNIFPSPTTTNLNTQSFSHSSSAKNTHMQLLPKSLSQPPNPGQPSAIRMQTRRTIRLPTVHTPDETEGKPQETPVAQTSQPFPKRRDGAHGCRTVANEFDARVRCDFDSEMLIKVLQVRRNVNVLCFIWRKKTF